MIRILRQAAYCTCFVFMLTSCSQLSVKNPPLASQPAHHVIECLILDSTKILRTYGGSRCIFLPDGSFISGSHTKLKFFQADMSLKWEKPINTHHQMNLSLDQRHVLVMTSRLYMYDKKKVRFDVLQVYDFDGNLLKEFDSYNFKRDLKKMAKNYALIPIGESMRSHVPPDVNFEFSHANSFYEIGENTLEKNHPAFAKGNYIINFNGLDFVAILSHDLKQILWSMPQIAQKNWDSNWHDVHLQADGWLLVYNNHSSKVNGQPTSSLDEVHPITGERKILYQSNPSHQFFAGFCGGIQKLPHGNILFSEYDEMGRAYEINSRGEIVWTLDGPLLDPKTQLPEGFLDIRRQDLTSFLEKNKGL